MKKLLGIFLFFCGVLITTGAIVTQICSDFPLSNVIGLQSGTIVLPSSGKILSSQEDSSDNDSNVSVGAGKPVDPVDPTPKPLGTFLNFYSDLSDIAIGDPQPVHFFAEILMGDEPQSGEISVYDDMGSVICTLYDDAQNADAIMGDNIFSGSAEMSSDNRTIVRAHAAIDGKKSDAVIINFYLKDMTTTSEYQKTLNVEAQISDLMSQFPSAYSKQNTDTSIPDSATSEETVRFGSLMQEQMDLVEAIFVEAKASGAVESYERFDQDNTIIANFSSGIVYMWAPHEEGVNSLGYSGSSDDKVPNVIGNGRSTHITPAPEVVPERSSAYSIISHGQSSTQGRKVLSVTTDTAYYYQQQVDAAAAYLTKSSLGFAYTKLTPAGATISNLKTALKGYDAVLWIGHGWFNSSYHSALTTGEKYTAAADAAYSADLSAKRLIHMSSGKYAVSGDFFKTYYATNDFPQTVFYFGTCLTGKDSYLADVLINKGASAVVAYNESVNTSYEYDMMLYTVQQLSQMDSTGSQSKTVNAAVTAAKNRYGQTDASSGNYYKPSGNKPAWLRIFGDANYSLYKKPTILNIDNASFENGLDSWILLGDCRVIQSMGALKPTNGNFMAMLGTGMGYQHPVDTSVESQLTRAFTINKGQRILLDYNFVSEELPIDPDWVGIFNDTLQISVIVNGTEYLLCKEDVWNSQWQELGDDYFYGGDTDTYHTGWKTLEIDPSLIGDGNVIGSNTSITIKIHVWDEGDSFWDSVAIIDNLRAAS